MKEETKRSVLGQNLYNCRNRADLTQQQMANMLKIKRSTYAYYEKDIIPSPKTLKKLSQILGVPIHNLLYGYPEDISRPKSSNDLDCKFADLSDREKQLICQFRFLTEDQKEKYVNDIKNTADKNLD